MPNITTKMNHAITYTNNVASEHYGGYFDFVNCSIAIIKSKRRSENEGQVWNKEKYMSILYNLKQG